MEEGGEVWSILVAEFENVNRGGILFLLSVLFRVGMTHIEGQPLKKGSLDKT